MSRVEAAAVVGVSVLTKVQPHDVIGPVGYDNTWAHIKLSIQNDGLVRSSLILALANTGLAAPVQLLLTRGASIDIAAIYYRRTPLILAASKGHETVVRLLLNNGAKINARDVWDFTALIWASIGNHERVVRLLVENGADLNLKSNVGKTAWDYAVDGRNEGIKNALQAGKNGYLNRDLCYLLTEQCRTNCSKLRCGLEDSTPLACYPFSAHCGGPVHHALTDQKG